MSSSRSVRPFSLMVFAGLFASSITTAQTTVPVSVDVTSTTTGNSSSGRPDFDFFGHFVVFESEASNLVLNDTNGHSDIFVRDLVNGTTTRVSVASDGTQGNRASVGPAISASGHVIAFSSYANNLVPNDVNDNQDVFIHDMRTGETRLVSKSTTGEQANEDCYNPTLDESGRFVAYESIATNLVPNDTNHKVDVFLTDTWTGVTTRVSVGPGGLNGDGPSGSFPRWKFTPRISHDGDRIVFPSFATNLVSNDSNGMWDVFLHDTNTGLTTRISEGIGGVEANGPSMHVDISHGGHFAAFVSEASNLVPGDVDNQPDVFIKNLDTGDIERVSLTSTGIASNQSRNIGPVRISGDGRSVIFTVTASDLVPGDFNHAADIVVHDRLVDSTFRVSVATNYVEGNGASDFASMSGNGQFVAFESMANNLASVADTNNDLDVFVHQLGPEQWRNYGPGTSGTLGVPALVVSGTPRLGQTFQLEASNAAGVPALGVLVVGMNFADQPFLGGQLLVQADVPIPVTIPVGGFNLPISVPNVPALYHTTAYAQVLHEDLISPAGFAFTKGLEINFF